jgi:hypothetical protein
MVTTVLVVLSGQASQTQVSTPSTVPGVSKPVVVVQGRIAQDVTFAAANIYVLRGAVFVDAGATLTIEPGTLIAGEFATSGTLVIARDGRIVADGRPDAPIVFTSDQPVGERRRGDWGGLIINGRAPINIPGGEAFGEGDTGVYGGDNPNDDSGVLRYVRVEFAGTEFSPDNELNGIAFQGVGRGTIVDHVQVKLNKDDGLEFFGGTVDVKHAIMTGIGDDSFDWTFGWQGRGQFWIAQQRGDDADNGFEGDNNGNNNDLLPRSNPVIFNYTLVGDPDFIEGGESDAGMLIREGSAGTFRNFIVIGFKEDGLDIDQAATFRQLESGALQISHGTFFGNGPNFDDDGDAGRVAAFVAGVTTIGQDDPELIDPFSLTAPVFRPAPDSPVVNGLLPTAIPPNDGFFDVVFFRGALAAEPEADWTLGWTNYEQR